MRINRGYRRLERPQWEQKAIESALNLPEWSEVAAMFTAKHGEPISVEVCRVTGRRAEAKLRELLAGEEYC